MLRNSFLIVFILILCFTSVSPQKAYFLQVNSNNLSNPICIHGDKLLSVETTNESMESTLQSCGRLCGLNPKCQGFRYNYTEYYSGLINSSCSLYTNIYVVAFI